MSAASLLQVVLLTQLQNKAFTPPAGSSSSNGACGGQDAVVLSEVWQIGLGDCQQLCEKEGQCTAFAHEIFMASRSGLVQRCRSYGGLVSHILPQAYPAVCWVKQVARIVHPLHSRNSGASTAPCKPTADRVCGGLFCFFDPRCSSPAMDPLSGRFCNAAQLHQNCRYCDISGGGDVPCPLGQALQASTHAAVERPNVPSQAAKPQIDVPCTETPKQVCGGLYCYLDPRCSGPGTTLEKAGCNAAGLHPNCRMCDIAGGGPVACPIPTDPVQAPEVLKPMSPEEVLNQKFATSGLLFHGLSLRYDFDMYKDRFLAARSLEEVPFHTDCGEHCTAFTYLHADNALVTFAFNALVMQGGILYEANPSVWDDVQCLSVTDKTTLSRACCACGDSAQCPFGPNYEHRKDSGYCGLPCAAGDKKCRQLAVGCGVSVFDATNFMGYNTWGPQTCSQEQIASGQCDLCTQPMWCDDPSSSFGWEGVIRTPRDWIDEFLGRDGDKRAWGIRQCMWKPSQRDRFVATVAELHMAYQRGRIKARQHNLWNEVSVYVEAAFGPQQEKFATSIAGFVLFRNLGANRDDLVRYHAMKQHLKSFGLEVPIFEITVEGEDRIDLWKPGVPVNLLDRQYSLKAIA